MFQVRFIDAESATIAEEVYDHLQSAKLAIDALHSMMAPPAKYRKDIGKRFIAKVGLIIKKFMAGTKPSLFLDAFSATRPSGFAESLSFLPEF